MTDEFDRIVREALEREASKVRPSPDGLDRIRDRISSPTPRYGASGSGYARTRRPWLWTASAAVVGTAAAITAFAVLVNDRPAGTPDVAERGTPSPTAERRPSVSPTPTPTATSPRPSGPTRLPTTPASPRVPVAQVRAVPAYWLGETVGITNVGPRLYRTYTRVEAQPGAEGLALAGVNLLTSGRPDDPDYSSAWTGASVASVTRSGGVITVDFKALPPKQLSAEEAPVAIQQLVYTVQAALQVSEPVRITETGQPVSSVFGASIAQPVRRAPAQDVQASIWITTPGNGATVTSPVKVSGIAAVFEATVSWRVVDPTNGREARSGFTNAAQGMTHSPYAFEVDLPAGTWRLEVYESSPEDGRPTNTDTKIFTVR